MTHEAQGEKPDLCTDGLIHAYESPIIAVLLNPIHANYSPARLWRCESDAELVREGQVKCGVRRLTCVEELPVPQVTTAQRVRFGILCAWEMCEDASWREWASRWLAGDDRSKEAAWAAAEAAWAVAEAARAAARAWAWAAEEAEAARAAARVWAAEAAATDLDLRALAERAIREEI